MRVCIHGNIGAGKSTFISRFFPDYEKVPEPVDKWKVSAEDLSRVNFPGIDTDNIFEKYNNTLSHSFHSYTDQLYMFLFQCVVMRMRAEVYKSLDPNKNYVFERSIEEDMFIFGRYLPLPPFLQKKLGEAYAEYKRFEPRFNLNIYLREETEVLMQRIKQRNRAGE